jgi:hypothetical protein
MGEEVLQPSNEPGATRLAIVYDIVKRTGACRDNPVQMARLVGECVNLMLLMEQGKRDEVERLIAKMENRPPRL